MRQELVPGRGGLGAERGDDRGAGGAVLDRHPHPRALPGLGENLPGGRVCNYDTRERERTTPAKRECREKRKERKRDCLKRKEVW